MAETNQPEEQTLEQEQEKEQGRSWYFTPVVISIGVVVLFLVGLVAALIVGIFVDADAAANWVGMVRDMFIIVLALEGMFMGLAVIVLILQLAALLNVLQNEIKPIVDNAQETVSTVRGTTQFISQNVVEPVIKVGAWTTGIGAMLRELVGIRRSLKNAGDQQKIEE